MYDINQTTFPCQFGSLSWNFGDRYVRKERSPRQNLLWCLKSWEWSWIKNSCTEWSGCKIFFQSLRLLDVAFLHKFNRPYHASTFPIQWWHNYLNSSHLLQLLFLSLQEGEANSTFMLNTSHLCTLQNQNPGEEVIGVWLLFYEVYNLLSLFHN